MAEIQLVKRGNLVLTDSESAIVRRVLFDVVDGLGDTAKKRWRRFWNGILKAEAGEMAIITTATKRVGAFHRRQSRGPVAVVRLGGQLQRGRLLHRQLPLPACIRGQPGQRQVGHGQGSPRPRRPQHRRPCRDRPD